MLLLLHWILAEEWLTDAVDAMVLLLVLLLLSLSHHRIGQSIAVFVEVVEGFAAEQFQIVDQVAQQEEDDVEEVQGADEEQGVVPEAVLVLAVYLEEI